MRLIDADEFINELSQLYAYAGWDKRDIHFSLSDVACNLEMMPVISVVTPKHGHWEVVDGTEPRRYGCSVCKRLSWTEDNYCSYCGSKMDEVTDE